MPTLAPKLPWQHAFAGGYPRRGGQPLPTDPDAIDYLNRVAAADGASVEVGIAQAIDAFVRGCKADGTWDAIKASCIMCGARTLSGALVPLKGTAPTPYNFASGDYSRSGTPGLKGDGTTKYIDTNRANNADGQNDNHNVVFCSQAATALSGYLGSGAGVAGGNQIAPDPILSIMNMRNRRNVGAGSTPSGYHAATGFMGHSRSVSSAYEIRIASTDLLAALTSETPVSDNLFVFKLGSFGLLSNARLAFYSVGSSLSLSALDARVSTLVSQIAAAIP